MLRTLYKDPERFKEQYWEQFPGKYQTGDSARIDQDGYFWIIGRMDDVIKVSGCNRPSPRSGALIKSHNNCAGIAQQNCAIAGTLQPGLRR